MRFTVGVLLLSFAFPLHAQNCAQTFCLEGFAAARAANTTGVPSWLESGFGRLSSGADGEGGVENDATAELRLAGDWNPTSALTVRVHGLAREEETDGLTHFGITEAYVESRTEFAAGSRFRARLGMFLLPTSRENTESLWTSPYTMTWSAINTWIGEEVRPIGLDLDYRVPLQSGELSAGATLFGGNDTMGALLAWRGWSLGNRMSVFGEELPLPELPSLYDPAEFGDQQSGTVPLERDLDGRIGWSARARWSMGDLLTLQATRLDNRGDRGLYDGEYAWATAFTLVSGELRFGQSVVLSSEYMTGRTGMGWAPVFVDADFDSMYVMAAANVEPFRFSVRYDVFSVHERDYSAAESSDDDGSAWTAAAVWQLTRGLRLGAEFVDVNATHPAAASAELSPQVDSRRYLAEIRYRF